jgi:PAS domain S-box-containing protein
LSAFGDGFRDVTDLELVRVKPRHGFEQLQVLLAMVRPEGKLELLNPAWERALGYSDDELDGRSLCELMVPDQRYPRSVLRLLLDDRIPDSIEFCLRRKDGGRTRFRWHRQFDQYTQVAFIAGEEISPSEPRQASVANTAFAQKTL